MLLHGAGLWLVTDVLAQDRASELSADDALVASKKDVPLARLGDPSTDRKTLNWLGVETLDAGESGTLSDTAQAEQSLDASAAPNQTRAWRELAQRTAAFEQAISEAVESRRQAAMSLAEAIAEAASGLPDILSALQSDGEAVGAGESADPALTETAEQGNDRSEAVEEADLEGESTKIAKENTPTQGSINEASQAAGTANEQTEPTQEPVATPADREVPATAVNEKDLGQPLFAGGLRITTKRPDQSIYSEITSGRTSVRIKIYFNSEGKVVRVEPVGKPGKASVVNPVINAAYEWTAKPGNSEDGTENGVYTIPESGVSLTFVIRL